MTKRVVIAGCRDYSNYEEAKEFIAKCFQQFSSEDNIIILSGCCRGADLIGERFAKEYGFEIEYFPAQWQKFKSSAGPVRNKQMVDSCDYIICFWNKKSKGTASLISYAQKCKKPIEIKFIDI